MLIKNGMRLLAGICMTAALTTSALAERPDNLRIGLLPAEDAGVMVEQFEGIEAHLSETLQAETTVWVSESYNALIEAMRSGHLDVAYVGGSQYLRALEIGVDVEPLAIAIDGTGRPYYKSSIFVRADSDIHSFEDLKGHDFAFVTPTSTSGGVAPSFLLRQNGIDPDEDLGRVIYAQQHDSVFLAVTNGRVAAGATGDLYFPRWRDRGILEYSEYIEEEDYLADGDIRIIGAVRVPGVVMIGRGALGHDYLEELRDAFTNIPEEVAERYEIWGPLLGFARATPEDFDELKAMSEMNGQ